MPARTSPAVQARGPRGLHRTGVPRHRLAKYKALWSPDPGGEELDEQADNAAAEEPTPESSFYGPDAPAEAELRKWAHLCEAVDSQPERAEVSGAEEHLKSITVEDLRGVAKRFFL